MSHGFNTKPGAFLGYRKNGIPIYNLGGGSHTDPQTQVQTGTPNAPTININNPPAQPQSKYFTEEEVQKIRQDEKDKLYRKMENFESELQTLREDRDKRIAEEQKRQNDIEAQQRTAAEAEMSAKQLIETRDREWEEKISNLQTQLNVQSAFFEKERAFQALKTYIQQQIKLHENEIMPQLYDTITGNTKEEIDASIENVIARTKSILESVNLAQDGQPRNDLGVRTTGFTPTGPIDLNVGLPQQMTEAQQLEWLRGLSYEDFHKQVRVPMGLDVNNSNSALWGQA